MQPIIKHAGKGSSSEKLPNRAALNRISGGDPADRTINHYSKAARSIVQSAADKEPE